MSGFIEAVPYQVHADNGIRFAEQPRNRSTIYSRPMRFAMICKANGIEHRRTKPTGGVCRIRPQSGGLLSRQIARSSG